MSAFCTDRLAFGDKQLANWIASNAQIVSPNGDSLTLTGAVVSTDRFFSYNGSLFFDGVDDYATLTTPTLYNTDDDTVRIAFAFYVDDGLADGDYGLFQQYGSNNQYLQCWLNVASGTYTLNFKCETTVTILINRSVALSANEKKNWNRVELFIQQDVAGGATFDVIAALRLNGLTISGPTTVSGSSNALNVLTLFNSVDAEFGRYTDPADDSQNYLSGFIDNFQAELTEEHDISTLTTSSTGFGATTPGAQLVEYSRAKSNINANPKNQFPTNIPHCVNAFDRLFVLGTSPNHVVYAPTLPPPVILWGGISSGSYTVGQTYYFACSLYNTTTFEETALSKPAITEASSTEARLAYNPADLFAGLILNRFDTIRVYVSTDGQDYYLLDEYTVVVTFFAPNTQNLTIIFNPLGDPTSLTELYTQRNFVYSRSLYAGTFRQENGIYDVTDAGAGSGKGFAAGTYSFALSYGDIYTGVHTPLIDVQVSAAPKTLTLSDGDEVDFDLASSQVVPADWWVFLWAKENSDTSYELVGFASPGSSGTIRISNPGGYIFDSSSTYVSWGTHNKDVENTIQPPPLCLCAAEHYSRMYFAAPAIQLSRVYFSEAFVAEQVDDASWITVGAINKPITGIHGNFIQQLVVFKNDEVWSLRGTDPFNFQSIRVSNIHGASSPNTIKEWDNKLFFANGSGAYLYDGSSVHLLSDIVRDLFNGLTPIQIATMSGAIDIDKEHYILNIVGVGQLIFHYKEWPQRTIWTTASLTDVFKIDNGIPPYVLTSQGQSQKLDRVCAIKALGVSLNSNTVIGDDECAILVSTDLYEDANIDQVAVAGISISCVTKKLTFKLGYRNHFRILKLYIELTQDETLTFGYEIKGSSVTTAFNLDSTVEDVLSKVGKRCKFIQVKWSGTFTSKVTIAGYSAIGDRVGVR